MKAPPRSTRYRRSDGEIPGRENIPKAAKKSRIAMPNGATALCKMEAVVMLSVCCGAVARAASCVGAKTLLTNTSKETNAMNARYPAYTTPYDRTGVALGRIAVARCPCSRVWTNRMRSASNRTRAETAWEKNAPRAEIQKIANHAPERDSFIFIRA